MFNFNFDLTELTKRPGAGAVIFYLLTLVLIGGWYHLGFKKDNATKEDIINTICFFCYDTSSASFKCIENKCTILASFKVGNRPYSAVISSLKPIQRRPENPMALSLPTYIRIKDNSTLESAVVGTINNNYLGKLYLGAIKDSKGNPINSELSQRLMGEALKKGTIEFHTDNE